MVARLDPPNTEQISRMSPDGRQVPSEAWALYNQQLARRIASMEATIAALQTALATETARATAAEAAGRGQPRVEAGTGNQIFDFVPGTYIARNATSGAVSVVVNSVVKVTWTP